MNYYLGSEAFGPTTAFQTFCVGVDRSRPVPTFMRVENDHLDNWGAA
jgi:hypothetical protein